MCNNTRKRFASLYANVKKLNAYCSFRVRLALNHLSVFRSKQALKMLFCMTVPYGEGHQQQRYLFPSVNTSLRMAKPCLHLIPESVLYATTLIILLVKGPNVTSCPHVTAGTLPYSDPFRLHHTMKLTVDQVKVNVDELTFKIS